MDKHVTIGTHFLFTVVRVHIQIQNKNKNDKNKLNIR